MALFNLNQNNTVEQDFTMIRGDSFCKGITLTSLGEVIFLDDLDTARFGVFSDGEVVALNTFGKDDQDENGRLSFGLRPGDTESLEPGKYHYELECEFSNGIIWTPLTGKIKILEDRLTPEVRNE